MAAAKGVLRYLNGTLNLGITYSKHKVEELQVFCDASYAEDLAARRSVSGFCMKLQGGLVGWRSTRQEVVATSSTEAEYIAYTPAVKELKWIQGVLEELGHPPPLPTVFWTDSQSGIALIAREGYRARTKHIDVRYHFIRDEVKQNRICPQYLRTDQMPADGLTKPLGGPIWDRFLGLIGLSVIQVQA